jgi:vacuolar-type H+-ATPase subunit H
MTKEIFNNEGSSIRRAENEVETWWKNLSDSAKKKAKKFWDEINEGSKKQIPTITNLKKGKIFKAIKARLKKSKD